MLLYWYRRKHFVAECVVVCLQGWGTLFPSLSPTSVPPFPLPATPSLALPPCLLLSLLPIPMTLSFCPRTSSLSMSFMKKGEWKGSRKWEVFLLSALLQVVHTGSSCQGEPFWAMPQVAAAPLSSAGVLGGGLPVPLTPLSVLLQLPHARSSCHWRAGASGCGGFPGSCCGALGTSPCIQGKGKSPGVLGGRLPFPAEPTKACAVQGFIEDWLQEQLCSGKLSLLSVVCACTDNAILVFCKF